MLVGIVDEKLLETVGVELLKSIDVQDTDEAPNITVDNQTRECTDNQINTGLTR